LDIDERIKDALQRLGEEPNANDPLPAIRLRRRRSRLRHRARIGSLALAVMAGTGWGAYTLLRTFGGAEVVPPAASPVEETLVFSSDRDGDFDIYLIKGDGKNVLPLTFTDTNEFDATWSPDGRQLVFVSDHDGNEDMYLMNADGSGVRQLTRGPFHDRSPSWSPNGEAIAFSSDRAGTDDLYLISPDGSDLQRLTEGVETDWQPAWSPNGKLIAFARSRIGPAAAIGPGQDFQIHLLDVETRDVERITDLREGALRPAWSPNGDEIVFEAGGDLFTVSAAGGEPQPVVLLWPEGERPEEEPSYPQSGNHDPSWSSGDWLAFFVDSEAGAELYVAQVAEDRTAMPIRVTRRPGQDAQPSWRPTSS
jgi:Tol biopolymer transport system component